MSQVEVVALERLSTSPFGGMPIDTATGVDSALREGRAEAWGAVRSGVPVGVVCALRSPDTRVAQLTACYVRPLSRRQGVATALITRLQRSLELQGHRRIWCRYLDGAPFASPWESLLRQLGWDEPAHLITHVRASTQDLLHAPWRRFTSLPAGLTCAPWRTVTSGELAQLHAAQRRQPWFPPEIAPWRAGIDAPDFDADHSMVLRAASGIVGWLLALRTDAATAHVSSAWIHPDLQRSPPGPPLVALCLRAIEDGSRGGYTSVTWSVHRDQERMAVFTRRHLRPYATEITHERVCGRAVPGPPPFTLSREGAGRG